MSNQPVFKEFYNSTTTIPKHKMAYVEWGNPTNPNIVICVHGLTRNSRDFDYLAKKLAEDYRVICPDIPGRGKSEWLEDKNQYNYETYTRTMINFIDYIGARQVNWVGTSMGGLIGINVAFERPNIIKKLVLNDIGPFIPATSLKRIAKYVGLSPQFSSLEEAQKHLRMILAPFNIQKVEHWNHLTEHSFVLNDQGKYQLCYDPAIVQAMSMVNEDSISDVNLWWLWEKINNNFLVLRGSNSDILLESTAAKMLTTKQNINLVTFNGIGHAPSLMEDDQIKTISTWLNK